MASALSETEARDALERWVRTTSWGRRGLARRLEITSFTAPGAHRVTFQSSLETRHVAPARVPYREGPIDGPSNGVPPAPWDIEVGRPAWFIDGARSFEVPHTAHVETCSQCDGRCRVTCSSCGGSGHRTCGSCSGSGSVSRTRSVTSTGADGQPVSTTESYSETCSGCGGSGRNQCSHCHGDGTIVCPTCAGEGRLRHFQRLDVAWINHVTVDVIEGTELPDKLIHGAEGQVLLLEEDPRVEPTAGTGAAGGAFRGGNVRVDAAVDTMANALIARHRFAKDTVVHRQRLTVHRVPVYRAEYRWGREARQFFVYGDERVHAPRYPVSIHRTVLAAVGVLAVLAAAGWGAYSLSRPPAPYNAVAPVEASAPPVAPPFADTDAAIVAPAFPAADSAAAPDADDAIAHVSAPRHRAHGRR